MMIIHAQLLSISLFVSSYEGFKAGINSSGEHQLLVHPILHANTSEKQLIRKGVTSTNSRRIAHCYYVVDCIAQKREGQAKATMGAVLTRLLEVFYTKKLDIVVIGLENRYASFRLDHASCSSLCAARGEERQCAA